jgi:hypothetical protein
LPIEAVGGFAELVTVPPGVRLPSPGRDMTLAAANRVMRSGVMSNATFSDGSRSV